MSLKDLRSYLPGERGSRKGSDKKVHVQAFNETDSINPNINIATTIVDKLYGHIKRCIKEERSTVRLNMFEKGAISSGLNAVLPGTKAYIEGMGSGDIKLLLGDILGCYTDDMIENELKKRRKIT